MTPHYHNPTREEVLSAIVVGRTASLELTREQKMELRDRDGQIALDVLRHTLPARPGSEALPLTDSFIQAVAKRLGKVVGIKRARAMRRRLVALGVLRSAGQYRPGYRNQSGDGTHRVQLYAAVALPSRKKKASVGRRSSVKQQKVSVRWWMTVFAGPEQRPPPGISKARARRMRSQDELRRA